MATDPGDSPPPAVDGSAGIDPVAALAILCGIAGIFVAQLVLVPLTLVLAAVAGGRARTGHGDISWAYTAFGIGAVDGILLLVSLVFNGSAPPKVPNP